MQPRSEATVKKSMQKEFKDLNDFLKTHNIKSTQLSDIFEHTLLKMAGVTEYGEGQLNYYDTYTTSHIEISIGQLTQADAEKFLNFFHQNGDKSAKISYSYYKQDSENILKETESDEETDCSFICKPSVTFNIDGAAFFNHLYPLFKETLVNLKSNDSAWLKPYIKPPKLTEVKDNELVATILSMFPPKNRRIPEDSFAEQSILPCGPGMR